MSLGDNTISPLQIPDARDAAFKASELQKQVEDEIRVASRNLANCERLYREALAKKILDLRSKPDAPAWTTCADVARGDVHVAKLKFERDVAEGVLEAMRQQAYRRGSDRRDLDTLLTWSMRRDLRVDAEPSDDRPALRSAA